jgi:predicted  nucleic acid-binding Zn-ribbon protein
MESLTSGTTAGAGSFRCTHCGYVLTLAGSDRLSDCPACGGSDFQRASLFSTARMGRGRAVPGAMGASARSETRTAPGQFRPERTGGASRERTESRIATTAGRRPGDMGADTIKTGPVAGSSPESAAHDSDARLQQARDRLQEPGEYLLYEEGGALKTVALTREWTRVGRSLAADVRFDDPTVSRRHALIVRQADGVRVLDDRSLNGVFVNGERIDRSGVGQQALRDGDEIVVGRYRLRFVNISPVAAEGATAATQQSAD